MGPGPGPWGLVPMGPGALSQWAMGWSLVPMGRAPGLVPMGPGPGALSQWAMGWSQWALGLEPFAQWAQIRENTKSKNYKFVKIESKWV